MRWKLLLIASLVAAVVGASGCYGLVYALYHFRRPLPSALTMLIVGELLPVIMSISASIFVYRHTARRRKLQVIITLLLSLLLAQAFISIITSFLPLFTIESRLISWR